MAEITILTAARTLQGEEVRRNLDGSFAAYYHDLDLGFVPINFLLPWAPLPGNKRRDVAHKKMRQVYEDIITQRRQSKQQPGHDMLWHLMENCVYKNGNKLPDKEIAHIMITLLMAGQHSSSSISSWILVRLAAHPEMMEGLYQEQLGLLGSSSGSLQLADVERLELTQHTVKETLRLHVPIHSLMRKVKNPMLVPGSKMVVPSSHILLATPGYSARCEEYFDEPMSWDPYRWGNDKDPSEGETGEEVDYGYGKVSKGAKSPYLPFGAGRHRCIGEKFAYLNLTVIVATMVRHFKFRNPDSRVGVPPTDYTVCSYISKFLFPPYVCLSFGGRSC